jgi:hypothetical protein
MKAILFSLFYLISFRAFAQIHTFTSSTTISSTEVNQNFSTLISDIAAKEPTMAAGTTTQYFRGDKSWQTLNTSVVPEGTNLYFMESRVRATTLTGFVSTSGAVLASDSILSAIGKLDGNINSLSSNFLPLSGGALTGTISLGGNKIVDIAAPILNTDAANKNYVDSQIATITPLWSINGPDIYFNTGRVGIGTTMPMGELDVVSSNASGTSITLDNILSSTGFKFIANSGNLTIHDLYTSLDRIVISSVGNVGIGTASPTALFQVGNLGDGSQGVANNWAVFSDERLKKNFTPVANSLDKFMSIGGYYYYWKDGQDTNRKMGVKAQEVEKVFPEIVTTNKDGIKSVSYDHLIAPVIEAIKELHQKVSNLEKKSQPLTRLPASEYQRLRNMEKEHKLLKSYLCQKDPKAPFCQKL